MRVAIATIQAGICGFETRARVEESDGTVSLTIDSDCPRIAKLTANMDQMDAMDEIAKRHNATLLDMIRDPRKGICPGCVVSAGIYKAMQVASGLALPAQSRIDLDIDE